MDKRGEHLSIFDINHEKAPSLAQITLQLTKADDKSTNSAKVVDWISYGIKTQNDQLVFKFILIPILI